MKFLFDDESFSFEALRAAGYASGSGADLGEVLVTCANIPDGDEEAWCREWGALADRIRGIGLAALSAGVTLVILLAFAVGVLSIQRKRIWQTRVR